MHYHKLLHENYIHRPQPTTTTQEHQQQQRIDHQRETKHTN